MNRNYIKNIKGKVLKKRNLVISGVALTSTLLMFFFNNCAGIKCSSNQADGSASCSSTSRETASDSTIVSGGTGSTLNPGSTTSSGSSASSDSSSSSSAVTYSDSASCVKNSSSKVLSGNFSYTRFGNYTVNNNNWGNMSNHVTWANSPTCWGTDVPTATTERGGVGSYPNAQRGWSNNGTLMQALSTPGTNDWTTKSGMGVSVTALTKSKVKWAFEAPNNTNTTTNVNNNTARWLALMDIYFHKTNNPSYTQFPPVVDLMINPAQADQVFGSGTKGTYYGYQLGTSNSFSITLGGNTYFAYVDLPSENVFHSTGGHTIHLFQVPVYGPNWGVKQSVTDVKAIIDYFMQANPKDNSGNPIKNASGQVITSPLITSDLYLNAINAGFEIDIGTTYKVHDFCVAMQNEADCQ